MKFAAIDIGTNAARLLIGEVLVNESGLQIQKLGYYRSPLRLGADVFGKGKIGATKLKQFIQTMQAFQLLASAHQVTELRAVATSAMREASNNKKVAKEIFQATGLQIEVISGEEEAKLIFSAFELLHLGQKTQYIVVDVGGGSTEISVFEDGQGVRPNLLSSEHYAYSTKKLIQIFGLISQPGFKPMQRSMSRTSFSEPEAISTVHSKCYLTKKIKFQEKTCSNCILNWPRFL